MLNWPLHIHALAGLAEMVKRREWCTCGESFLSPKSGHHVLSLHSASSARPSSHSSSKRCWAKRPGTAADDGRNAASPLYIHDARSLAAAARLATLRSAYRRARCRSWLGVQRSSRSSRSYRGSSSPMEIARCSTAVHQLEANRRTSHDGEPRKVVPECFRYVGEPLPECDGADGSDVGEARPVTPLAAAFDLVLAADAVFSATPPKASGSRYECDTATASTVRALFATAASLLDPRASDPPARLVLTCEPRDRLKPSAADPLRALVPKLAEEAGFRCVEWAARRLIGTAQPDWLTDVLVFELVASRSPDIAAPDRHLRRHTRLTFLNGDDAAWHGTDGGQKRRGRVQHEYFSCIYLSWVTMVERCVDTIREFVCAYGNGPRRVHVRYQPTVL